MTSYTEEERRVAAADIAFRRRALKVNGDIYARRHAPRLMPVLASAGMLRARYIGQIAWLESERQWRPEDGSRLAEIADEIARFARFRADIADACKWHAERLRELVRQHAVLARLERKHRPGPEWPVARGRPSAPTRRRAPVQARPSSMMSSPRAAGGLDASAHGAQGPS